MAGWWWWGGGVVVGWWWWEGLVAGGFGCMYGPVGIHSLLTSLMCRYSQPCLHA